MIVFDAGALVALDRNDRELWADLRNAAAAGIKVFVPSAALAQAWRGGSRQARLAQALLHVERASFDEVAIAAGELCGRAGTEDVVDAVRPGCPGLLIRGFRVRVPGGVPPENPYGIRVLSPKARRESPRKTPQRAL